MATSSIHPTPPPPPPRTEFTINYVTARMMNTHVSLMLILNIYNIIDTYKKHKSDYCRVSCCVCIKYTNRYICAYIFFNTSNYCTFWFFFTAYTCYGHWKNEITGVNYVISTPQGRSATNSRRYCFIMSQVNGMAQQMLHIASVMESCHPHPLGRLHWAFNITHQGMIIS